MRERVSERRSARGRRAHAPEPPLRSLSSMSSLRKWHSCTRRLPGLGCMYFSGTASGGYQQCSHDSRFGSFDGSRKPPSLSSRLQPVGPHTQCLPPPGFDRCFFRAGGPSSSSSSSSLSSSWSSSSSDMSPPSALLMGCGTRADLKLRSPSPLTLVEWCQRRRYDRRAGADCDATCCRGGLKLRGRPLLHALYIYCKKGMHESL